MTPDPCYQPVARLPLPGERHRIRVVELLATGTNGGAQEHLLNLVTRIDLERYDVSVISLSAGSAVRRLERAGLPVCVIDEPDDAAAIEAVADCLAAANADVVHGHMYRAEVVGTQAAWRLSERPRPAARRAGAAAGKGAGASVGSGRRRPYVVNTVHSSRVRAEDDRALLRRLTPRMDHLIAVSRAIVRKLQDEGRVGAPVSLIYNGVDMQRYDHQEACCTLREEYEIPEGAPIVGVVARLEPEKGHPTLLEAWPRVLASVPDAHLLVVGEGSRRDELEAQAASLGLLGSDPAHPSSVLGRRVVFTGRRDDVPAVTAALDVAVLPSYREAQGLSILEAMALSRPVVASAVGGIPEVIEDGRSGLLVPPHDRDALARAITRLLLDHPYADLLGRAGRELAHERFCVELMVRAIESIYDESVAEETRRIAG
ncbi:MAG: glycosyltransferase [Chloroflexi bacterium]|nr:glycosyltransferase [Chloroflexota bacterium]